jgi:hypothetical protein
MPDKSSEKPLPNARESPQVPRFVGIKNAVMRGSECVAVACSKTFAKRIANALNNHKVNSEGV